jgi:hypothetical protein
MRSLGIRKSGRRIAKIMFGKRLFQDKERPAARMSVTLMGSAAWVKSEVGVSSLPPLSERIGLKNKNATDSTDYTDSKSLADDKF